MRVGVLATAVSVALGTGVPRTAIAGGASGAARAKELFERGRDLRSHGDCAAALPLFQKAYTLFPAGLGSLRNVAVCEEALGHLAAARAAWIDLRGAVGSSGDPKYAGWTDDADHATTRLSVAVGTLTVDLDVSAPPGGVARASGPFDGVDVTVDGVPLEKEQLGAPRDHDPGSVVVRASGSSVVAPDEQTAAVAAGQSAHVTLHVTLAPRPSGSSAAAAAGPDAESEAAVPTGVSRASRLRTGAWIAAGVGVAGLAGAAISFAFRQSALADLASSCPGYASGICDPSTQSVVTSAVDRGRTATTLIDAFGAVGIVGSLAGVTLFTLSATSSKQTAILVTPSGVGAAGTF